MSAVEEVDIAELVTLAATDHELYCKTFFPRTIKQDFADFHHDAWDKMSSDNRLINLLMFRGSGKTSHCRLYTSKMIAYGFARTVLYISKSETHAIRSTSWLRQHVENNQLWSETFLISPGSKSQDTEFELVVGPEGNVCWVMAAGITGTIRGVNRADFRPDLIVLDDVLDDENAHTIDQREKIENLVYGAVLESLAPKIEAPHAKLISANTPQHKEDFAVKALRDPEWLSAVYGCFTKDTAALPLDFQESAWPERLPTEQLRAEKRSAISRNMTSTWLREKECKLVSAETTSFQIPWLKKYALPPEKMLTVYAIDPVPPPSDAAVQKGRIKTDFEAHVVWGALGDKRYLLDYELMRGHEPTWTIATFFRMQQKWSPVWTLVETVAYQRVLMWILKKAMDERRTWKSIEEFKSRESKFTRIVNAHNGPASAGRLFVKETHHEFVEQFGTYPDVSHDDLLDASAIALQKLEGLFISGEGVPDLLADETSIRPLNLRSAP